MKKFVTALLLIGASLALQAQQQTCPIRVDKWSAGNDTPDYVYIEYTNIGTKPIRAVIFDITPYNSIGEEQQLHPGSQFASLIDPKRPYAIERGFTYYGTKPLRPDKSYSNRYANVNPVLGGGTYHVWVYGVRFADGAIWKDNGSHSCSSDFTF